MLSKHSQEKLHKTGWQMQKKRVKLPNNPILHYAGWSLLTENNDKNNTTEVRLYASLNDFWLQDKQLHTLKLHT